MPVEKRQRLLSVESFASVDLDPIHRGDEAYANDLVRLALFYQSKFVFENRFNRGGIGDLERAESYLRIAFAKSNADFTILNDLAKLYITFHKVCGEQGSIDFLKKAEIECSSSIRLEPDQQRPYYNLAVIEGKYRKNFPEAIAHSKDALKHDNWQRLPVKYTQAFSHYNLACYEARQLDKTLGVVTLPDATALLGALKSAASFYCLPADKIREDFGDTKGDLYPLYQKAEAALRDELDIVKKSLLQPTAQKQPITLSRALRDAWASIRTALSRSN